MTRFLSLALADLECGGVNRETERLFAYHQGNEAQLSRRSDECAFSRLA
jgi:hypothetical protein